MIDAAHRPARRFARRATLAVIAALPPIPAGLAIRAATPALSIAKIGAIEIGGRTIDDGKGGTLSCDHGHLEYLIPSDPRPVSMLFWHSSSTAVWQRRWDGGEGYVGLFLRRGYPVYLWDGPRVGRANWGCAPGAYRPLPGQDQRNFVAWRFGPRYGEWFPGVQFPTGDQAAWDQATRARYDEIDTVENIELQARAAAQAIDRIGPVVLVTNSAGGIRALLAATLAKSGNVRAIVSYENPAFVLPAGQQPHVEPGPYGPIEIPAAQFRKLSSIPMQFVWGDHSDATPGWTKAVAANRAFVDLINRQGGRAELLDLPAAGLHGNTHMPFADMNNDRVADQLSAFLRRQHVGGSGPRAAR